MIKDIKTNDNIDEIYMNTLFMYLCIFIFLFIFLIKSFIRVPPSRRLIVVHFQGTVRFLNEGLHIYPPTWYIYGQGPFTGIDLKNSNTIPAPGSRIIIDPKATQIQTADGISAAIDVQIEALVLNYDSSILQLNANISNLCSTRVNVWVSHCLGKVIADDLVYSNVTRLLNTKGSLEELNESLSGLCIRVDRVSVDANGISLSKVYQTHREEILAKRQVLDAREKQIQREMEIMELENATKLRFQEAEILRKKALSNAETEISMFSIKIIEAQHLEQQQHIKNLLSIGLHPDNCSQILGAELATKALKDTPNVSKILSVPQNMLGFTSSSFEKV